MSKNTSELLRLLVALIGRFACLVFMVMATKEQSVFLVLFSILFMLIVIESKISDKL